MSKKQWMALLMLFLTYLLLGASIFYHIESRLEVEKVNKAREERIQINGESSLFRYLFYSDTMPLIGEIIEQKK